MVFAVLLAIPLLFAIGAFILSKGITWKEFLAQVAAQVVVAAVSALIVSCGNTSDTEIWNGVVTKKEKSWVPCSHSYSCHCHEVCSGSGKNKSCSEHCDTCYEHSNDWDWDVYTSNGEGITIDRIDRRGSDTPPRWTAVKIGEPTALEHSYTNYIKAAPDTLFRHQGLVERYKDKIPKYPGEVYDYYRLDRLVTVGFGVVDPTEWNADIADVNAELGKPRQANIIVVLVRGLPQDYFYALEEAWLGGKKNDIALVIGVDSEMKPQWTSVMAWTTAEIFKVRLRDDIMDDPMVTRESVMKALRTNVATYYVRKPMKDFEYLKASITPTTTQWVISIVIGLLVCGGLTFMFATEDVFDGDTSWFRDIERLSILRGFRRTKKNRHERKE
jgi:hypothetical protein